MKTPQFGNDAITHSVYYKMVEYERCVENWQADMEAAHARIRELEIDIGRKLEQIVEMQEFVSSRGYDI